LGSENVRQSANLPVFKLLLLAMTISRKIQNLMLITSKDVMNNSGRAQENAPKVSKTAFILVGLFYSSQDPQGANSCAEYSKRSYQYWTDHNVQDIQ